MPPSPNPAPVAELRDVAVTTAGLRGQRVGPTSAPPGDRPVLDGISLTIEAGELVAVLGESGGGKSTLLRLLNGMWDPTGGEVRLWGTPVEQWKPAELRRRAVFVPQRPSVLAETVGEDLAVPLEWARRTLEDPQRWLDLVQLGDLDPATPTRELSEGQRLRLSLARALALEPKLLLLDEPTSALDVRTARELLAALVGWARSAEAAVVLVTHRPADLQDLQGRALVLLAGQVAADVPAGAIVGNDPTALPPAVRDFFQGHRGESPLSQETAP